MAFPNILQKISAVFTRLETAEVDVQHARSDAAAALAQVVRMVDEIDALRTSLNALEERVEALEAREIEPEADSNE